MIFPHYVKKIFKVQNIYLTHILDINARDLIHILFTAAKIDSFEMTFSRHNNAFYKIN